MTVPADRGPASRPRRDRGALALAAAVVLAPALAACPPGDPDPPPAVPSPRPLADAGAGADAWEDVAELAFGCTVERAIDPVAESPLVFAPCAPPVDPFARDCVELLRPGGGQRAFLQPGGPVRPRDGVARPFLFHRLGVEEPAPRTELGVGDLGRGIVSVVRACASASVWASPSLHGFVLRDRLVALDLRGALRWTADLPTDGLGSLWPLDGWVAGVEGSVLRVLEDGELRFAVEVPEQVTALTRVGDFVLWAEQVGRDARLRAANGDGPPRTLETRPSARVEWLAHEDGWVTWIERGLDFEGRPLARRAHAARVDPVEPTAASWQNAWSTSVGDGGLPTFPPFRHGPVLGWSEQIIGLLQPAWLRDVETRERVLVDCPFRTVAGGACHSPLFLPVDDTERWALAVRGPDEQPRVIGWTSAFPVRGR